MKEFLVGVYKTVVIEKPFIAISMAIVLIIVFGIHVPKFKLDASGESLVLENDEDLQYYRAIRDRYGFDNFLIVTYTPDDDLLSERALTHLRALRDDLLRLDRVESVISILDVPLLNSPKVSMAQLSTEVKTLETPGIDRELARKEFLESPIYRNNLVSLDGKTTALQVNLYRDDRYFSLLRQRNALRDKKAASGLTKEEAREFDKVSDAFKDYHAVVIDKERQDIADVRRIMSAYQDVARMHLGGVTMITADMISFIQHDLVVFGLGVICFLMLALSLFFRTTRWVILPLVCCFTAVVIMIGFLGLFDWRVTVISSNFISILLIITMSITIHLIVRYRILHAEHPTNDQRTLVFDMVRIMAKPCFYTAITTIVAFASLIVSDIRPVIDFGWIMTIGITVAFGINFLFFPAVLVLLSQGKSASAADSTQRVTLAVASFTQHHRNVIFISSIALIILIGVGIPRLKVENRFIDHFKPTTEIYQGMMLIDRQLGGTTPLEIILDPDPKSADSFATLDASDDPFEDPFATEQESLDENYWFNAAMLKMVETIHDRISQFPEVGKVLSIATAAKVLTQLNDGRLPGDYELAVLRKVAPENVKQALLNPYLSEDGNQLRITMRLIDSSPTLRRKAFIERVNRFLVEEMGLPDESVHLTGMMVLYNNMLQSLYRSQILTLGAVFFSILAMFLILFRSLLLAILAIIPNLLAAGVILGIMGLADIPLDMMTITIAAITVGIAVDHAIHYIHRFQMEFATHRRYAVTVERCHGSIGKAIYYTALTITVGFSILALSSFIPTIYFGLLTGFAMLVALLTNLTLLPALLVASKPLGPEGPDSQS